MSFSFKGPQAPLALRVCRALLWAQAVLVILGGIAVVLFVALGTESIPVANGTLSGSGAQILGAVYIAAGVVLMVIGLAVGQIRPWARIAAVSVQVFLAILLVMRSFDVSVSTFLNAALFVAIITLLYVPPSNAAFAGRGAAAPE